eukprot:366450-Chlamydomonas_euryale.AAC.19
MAGRRTRVLSSPCRWRWPAGRDPLGRLPLLPQGVQTLQGRNATGSGEGQRGKLEAMRVACGEGEGMRSVRRVPILLRRVLASSKSLCGFSGSSEPFVRHAV